VSDALKLNEMPRLLRLLATQAAGLLNYRTVADCLELHPDTVKSYVQLLETVFLVYRLPSWRPGLGTREIHAPKLNLVDSGLLAHHLGADPERIRNDDQVTRKLLENFVAMERGSPDQRPLALGNPRHPPDKRFSSARAPDSCSRSTS
jgi:predicted AAA+ superfamily ATPase